jgi:hypothetical protein
LAARWEDVLKVIRQLSITAFAMLHQDANSADSAGGLVVSFRSPDLARAFASRFQSVLEEAAGRVAGRPVEVQVVSAGEMPRPPAVRPPAAPTDSDVTPKDSAVTPRDSAVTTPAPASSATPSVDDEPSPDDPDAGVRGLTGVPLVVEMLGGKIVEQTDEA